MSGPRLKTASEYAEQERRRLQTNAKYKRKWRRKNRVESRQCVDS